MKMQKYALSLQQVPADLFADPDGSWSYEALLATVGLDPDVTPPPVIAALAEPWDGHPDGAAVVAGMTGAADWVAIIECDGAGRAPAVSRAA